eukprot:2760015-Pyramimonas_sp.AAC.1
MFVLGINFENREDERQSASGIQLIDPRVPNSERIDEPPAGFEMARPEAQPAGFDAPSLQLPIAVLFRGLG